MKQIIKLYITIIAVFINACSLSTPTISSQNHDNKTLQQENKTKESGYIQRNLDEWLEKDWNPAVAEKEEDTQKRFKLQDYVDKASLYIKSHPNDINGSNVKKLEAIPVIGK